MRFLRLKRPSSGTVRWIALAVAAAGSAVSAPTSSLAQPATSDRLAPTESAAERKSPLDSSQPDMAAKPSAAVDEPRKPEAFEQPASNRASPTAQAAPIDAAPSPATTPAAVAPPSAADTSAAAPAPVASASTGLRLAVRRGAHLAAQQRAIHAPFVAQTGTPIVVMAWPATSNPLQETSAGKPSWDLAEVDIDEARKACDAGQIERIDPDALTKSPDGMPIERDYIAGGLTPCAVGSVAWSSLVAYDQRAWPAAPQPQRGAKRPKGATPRQPVGLKDFFDVAAFPGKRAVRRSPRYLLEMGLIADGVAPDEVYRMLAGEAGTHRAFSRLEVLRGHINWIESPAAASRQLAERSAVMAMVYSGRAFQNVAVEAKSFGLIWDGQIYHLDAWVMAKGTPQARAARAFLGFASDPVHLAVQASLFAYGPPRASAVARVGRHPVLKTEMSPYLPTAPANLRTALQFDATFWDRHERRLTEAFEAWVRSPLPQPPPEPSAPAAGDRQSPTPSADEPSPSVPAAGPEKSG